MTTQDVRVLVLGSGGQVGQALTTAAPTNALCTGMTSRQLDIRDGDAVLRALVESGATVVINCAAVTQVDQAEGDATRAHEVNAVAPGVLARVAREAGARLLHLSTDYVFDGASGIPYTTDAPRAPLSVYGRSKADGEDAVLRADPDAAVIRTAWVHSAHSRNFVRLVYEAMRRGDTVEAVDDQLSSPTAAAALAHSLWRLVQRPDVRGILHVTDAGTASRYDVAIAVHDLLHARGQLGRGAAVVAVPQRRFPTPARRPLYSVLDKHSTWAALGEPALHWTRGVRDTVDGLLDA